MTTQLKANLLAAMIAVIGLSGHASERGKLSAAGQAAIATAFTLMDGYGGSNQWVLVKCESKSVDVYHVSISVCTNSQGLLGLGDTNKPPVLLAVVETTLRDGAKVIYKGQRQPASGNENAYRAAVAYRSQQGWLPSGFWMNCVVRNDVHDIFFWTEPNRWPGDHCNVEVSTNGIRFVGGL